MKIRIADKNIGECVIDSKNSICKSGEYTIKSLCMLQMMCMHGDKDDPNFTEFINIVKEAVHKINILYHGYGTENTDDDPVGHLGN